MEIVQSTDYESLRKGQGNFAQTLIDRAGPDYYSLEQAAQIFGVKKPALRAQIRRKDLPFSVIVHGKMEVILLDEEQLAVAAHAHGEPATTSAKDHFKKKYGTKPVPANLRKILDS